MLNLFAATGHINYAKCARLYLQKMNELPETHPWLHQQFVEGKHAVTRTGNNWTAVPTDQSIEQSLMRSAKSRGGLTRGRGFNESVRNLWVLSLSHSARLDHALNEFAGLHGNKEIGNKELGKARQASDMEHTSVVYNWLSQRNPFLVEDTKLYSLSTGIVSNTNNDDVNCERAEEIGKAIQQSFDNKTISQCCIKRKNLINPLSSLVKIKSKKDQSVPIDNQVMFIRLVAIKDRVDSFESLFKHELTTTPASLFKGGTMRKTKKSALLKVLLPDNARLYDEYGYSCGTTVVDGGALLHRLRWMKDTTFSSVANLYYGYICRNYKNPTVIFDGYENATTKDHERARRNSIPQSSFVAIIPDNLIPYTQNRYFSLEDNKKEFVKFLSNYLGEKGVELVNCKGDADSEIVRVALSIARQNVGTTAVVADDTDIAVMLLYHYTDEMDDIFLLQPNSNSMWSMKKSQNQIMDIKEHLLFIHAFSGCDTTSSTYEKGKASAVAQLRKSVQLRQCSRVITSVESTPHEVGTAAIKAFKIVYGAPIQQPLAKAR
jgi:hypothetical protein